MIIAIDFDKTFSADPVLFRAFVALVRSHGHRAIMVTQRCAKFADAIAAVVELPDLDVVFASGRTKEEAARGAGYLVDIWVDDNPYSVSTALTYRGCEEAA